MLIDFARITITNAYRASSTSWGWLYKDPTLYVPVSGAMAADQLSVGDAVCRDSQSTGSNCGLITSVADGDGAITVDSNMVPCHGDSDGSVYKGTAPNIRIAVGLISGIVGGQNCCVGGTSGGSTFISPIDGIYHYMDSENTASVRLDFQ